MTNGKTAVRAHIVVPSELVRSVDEMVGRRGRSRFFAEAAAEKLARLRLLRAAEAAAGSLADEHVPGWESSEAAAEWVNRLREADETRLREIAAGSGRS